VGPQHGPPSPQLSSQHDAVPWPDVTVMAAAAYRSRTCSHSCSVVVSDIVRLLSH
jgi:hypothetical protein